MKELIPIIMKNLILYNTKFKYIKSFLYVLAVLFVSISNGQTSATKEIDNGQLVLTKTISPTAVCNQYDVQLKIVGHPTSRPLEVMLVIDRSGSMGFSIPGDPNDPIDYAQEAAIEFMRKLFDPANNPTGLNKLGIASYASTGRLDIGLRLAQDSTAIKNKINALSPSGATNIGDGIVKADNEFKNNGTFDCKTIRSMVVMTDGVANQPGSNSYARTFAENSATNAYITTNSETSNIDSSDNSEYNTTIHTIGLFGAISGSTESTARTTMQTIAANGHGTFQETESAANLNTLYQNIFSQLAWSAKQISSNIALVKEELSSGFSLVGTPTATGGSTATVSGQDIFWYKAYVYDETLTLNYTVEANPTTCGESVFSTSGLYYINAECIQSPNPDTNPPVIKFDEPTFTAPCPATISAVSPICSGSNAVFTITGSPNKIVSYKINNGSTQTVSIGAGGTVDVTIPNTTTNKTLTILNEGGTCNGPTEESATVTVNESPVGTDKELTIDSGGTLNEILSSNIPNSTFSWQAADNVNISGETTSVTNTSNITDTLTNLTGSIQDVVYTITPSSPLGCAGNPYTITVHVNPKLPTISINDQLNINEGSTANFDVTLSNTYIYDVTFTVNTQDGTAEANGDYNAITNQTFTIPAGSTTVIIPVTINTDNIYEPIDETYQLKLSDVTISTINLPITTTDLIGDGSIVSNDAAPTISIDNITVVEGATANFTAILSSASQYDVTFTAATTDVSAVAGSDYVALNQTFTIPAGQTTVTVPVVTNTDDLIESDEIYTLTLRDVLIGMINETIANASGTGTIEDTNGGNPNNGVTINDVTVNESEGQLVFSVTLTGNVQGGFSLEFNTSDNSALVLNDYIQSNGILNFVGTDGEKQFVTIEIINDNIVELTESFNLLLSNLSTNLIALNDNLGVGTIIDEDANLNEDFVTTEEETAVTIPVLENDIYASDDIIGLTEVTNPSDGTVVVNTDGTVTYTPNPDFNGIDTFTYTVTVTNSDGSTTTETATVTVTVNPVGDVQDDTAETIDQNPVEIDVLANDTFNSNTNVEVTSVTTPTNGSVVINSAGTVSYTANEGFYGGDTFEYTVTVTNADGSTTTETATVTITVSLTPFAIDDEVVTDANVPIDINVLENDYDVDGSINPESVVITEDSFNGTVVVNADGTVTYTPDIDFIGDDTFVYQVCDNDGLCDTATVTVIVTGVLAAELIIPQGFSPNGDGVHDVFDIEGLTNLYPNFQLEIYNRWGNKVYDHTHNGNPLSQPIWWDGFSSGRMTINGKKQVPVGTYFYILHFNKDNAKPRTGYVYLNR